MELRGETLLIPSIHFITTPFRLKENTQVGWRVKRIGRAEYDHTRVNCQHMGKLELTFRIPSLFNIHNHRSKWNRIPSIPLDWYIILKTLAGQYEIQVCGNKTDPGIHSDQNKKAQGWQQEEIVRIPEPLEQCCRHFYSVPQLGCSLEGNHERFWVSRDVVMLEFKDKFKVPVMGNQMDALKLRILRARQDGVWRLWQRQMTNSSW